MPICCVSRVWKNFEEKYGITELGLARIVSCISKLRLFRLGTDYSSLLNVLNNKLKNIRIYRRTFLLQEHDLWSRYDPGKVNIVADTLMKKRVSGENDNFK